MPTVATLKVALGAESKVGEQGVADALSYFAEEASAQRTNPGRGILWGIFLAGGLWVGMFAIVFLIRR